MAFVGEAVVSAFIETLLDKLASSDLLQFARQEEVFADIKKWEKTLRKLHAVLEDAEEKQLTSRLVKMWLDDLRDLAYDVEDILDEFAAEALGRKLIMGAETQAQASSTSNKVWRRALIPTSCCTNFTPTAIKFNVKMRSKIEDVTSRLQDISAEKNDLHLSDNLAAARTPTTTRALRDTTCLIDESRVCGRKTDEEAILDLLFRDLKPSDDAFHVIAIIGMGGLGKTTLAQLAFNDDKAKNQFDLRVWVCVSDHFDVLNLTKTILQSITSGVSDGASGVPDVASGISDVNDLNQLQLKPKKQASDCVSDVNDLNQLQLKLKERLSGKKFLLVLDDVWNENHRVWETFYHPMRSGAQGSRFIVTTRNQGVISAIGACSAYPLKGLSDDECLSLLAQQALGSKNFDNYPDLRVVGEQIAKKCKGLPLAAKTLGGMLSTNQNLDAWEYILKSKIWDLPDQENNEILPALKLSYHHLPSHLKSCFAYCSIFPKDYQFHVDELVLLWMAEGFLDKVKGRKKMEEIGTEFFHELSARSFFQQPDPTLPHFVMHDLVHDLARFVAGDTCFNLEYKLENNQQLHTISERARHSSFIHKRYEVARNFEAFGEVKTNLRTLISLSTNIRSWANRQEIGYISQKVLHGLLTGMKCLRVLSLEGYYIRDVPDLIGQLKHLRYLNFSICGIERLPDSIGDLYNLQTLILRDCRALIRLPEGIGKLKYLRHLDIIGTSLLQEMSFQVGNLTNLQTLSRFIVGKSGGSRIGELKNLSDLREVLYISKLHEIAKVEDASDANLKNKQKLNELIMEWTDELWDSRNVADELQVLESLQPHENLERLTVQFYGGSKFPSWIGDPSFSRMMKLILGGCKKCTSLPTLGGLPSLQVLRIQGMGKVESIGDEFYGECMINPAFASLKELQFENMPEWESWSHSSLMKRKNMRVFPKLEKLEIRKCRKLKGELPKWLQSLVKLEVSECPELVMWRGDEEEVDLGSLATLQLEQISRLDCLRMGQTLRSMESLTELVINDCGGLRCLWEEQEQGQGVLLLGNLKNLRIKNCANLEKLPSEMQISVMIRLEELEIEKCPKLESFPETGLPSMLRSLKLMDCKNLKGLPHNFNSCALEFLEIRDCESLKFFPTGTGTGELQLQLPSTLKRLEIRRCSNLESISGKTLCPNNSVLEYIELWVCPNLRTLLPECLSSLKELHLRDCEGLECFSATELGLSTPNLAVLSIFGCQDLKSMPHQMRNLKSLVRLSISECPVLESFPEGGLPPNLTSLEVGRCENLKTPISDWGLQSLTSLSELTIKNMFPDMVSFPDDEQCLLPSSSLSSLTLAQMASLTSLSLPKLHSLTSLEVVEMESLASLPLQYLTSLQSLNISYCPNLRSLGLPSTLQTLIILRCPKLRSLGSLPSTLETLVIFYCPIIRKRYLQGKGDYFAHIPLIYIVGDIIYP